MSATPARGGRGVAATLALALAAAAVAVVVDLTSPPRPVARAESVPNDAAAAGTWYCPVLTAGAGEAAALDIAAVGDRDSQVTLVRHGGERAGTDHRRTVPAGTAERVDLGADAGPVTLRWDGGPAVVTWQVGPQAITGAPCVDVVAATWYLTGFDTTLGSQSLLHLFNPFTTDAVVNVRFASAGGPVELVATTGIAVPAGDMVAVDLGEAQPEQEDLGVVVEVAAGRVVAQGEVRAGEPGGEDGERRREAGRALLAAGELSESLSFVSADAGEGVASWLSVMNPSDREAAVAVVVTAPGDSPAARELSVPAGGTARVGLADLSSEPVFGVTLETLNGVPVVAQRVTAVATGDDSTVPVSAAPGVAQAHERWALAVPPVTSAAVALYNPGPQAAAVVVTLDGETPARLGELRVDPNTHLLVDLPGAAAATTAVALGVQADEPVVAGLRTGAEEAAPTLAAVPWRRLSGATGRLPVRHDPFLDTVPVRGSEPAPVDGG